MESKEGLNMPTILVIEDETAIMVAIEDALNNAGFNVLSTRNGQQGLKYALEEEYDLIILDLMLPKMNGLEILKRLRMKDKYVPIIILTAKSLEQDKVKGFDLGADDYMTKPFGVKELVARIKTRLKHANNHAQLIARYSLEGIDFDFESMIVKKGKKILDFSARELELLRYLLSHKGRVVTREQILQDVWKYDIDQAPMSRSIDNYILKLRQKIEKESDQPKYLVTVHGRGYRFMD